MVVGLQGRGKTTLLSVLRDPTASLPENISTVGVNVADWVVKAPPENVKRFKGVVARVSEVLLGGGGVAREGPGLVVTIVICIGRWSGWAFWPVRDTPTSIVNNCNNHFRYPSACPKAYLPTYGLV